MPRGKGKVANPLKAAQKMLDKLAEKFTGDEARAAEWEAALRYERAMNELNNSVAPATATTTTTAPPTTTTTTTTTATTTTGVNGDDNSSQINGGWPPADWIPEWWVGGNARLVQLAGDQGQFWKRLLPMEPQMKVVAAVGRYRSKCRT